jgi:hypothetical protein
VNLRQRTIIAIGVCLQVTACGAPNDSSTEDPAPTSANETLDTDDGQVIEPVHTFTAGHTEYTLAEAGPDGFTLAGQAPRYVARLPHDVLQDEYGRLTLLEIVLALDPAYSPSESLVDHHRQEAAFYGREDLSIQRLEFVEPLVEKGVRADCLEYAENLLPPYYGVGSAAVELAVGPTDVYATNFTDTEEALAVCNGGSATITAIFGWQFNVGNWQYFPAYSLPTGARAFILGHEQPYPYKIRHLAYATNIDNNDTKHVYFAWASPFTTN